jgi:flagellar motor switch protein FliM
VSRQLSQQEIDDVFQSQDQPRTGPSGKKPQPYDFRRPDRISKTQVRAIHSLHDTFVRNLATSLSAYLRAYLTINLISVEQLPYSEFLECLPAPTCIAALGMKPYEGNAVIELNPALIFPILEILLGGSGKTPLIVKREVTEIERDLLQAFFRVVVQDLKTAWRSVAEIDFTVETMETEPQFLRILAPNEAVVAITIELTMGEVTGMLNLAIPCITIKMMRQKFDQQWSMRKSDSTPSWRAHVLDLIRPAHLELEALLDGPSLDAEGLVNLAAGDVLMFDYRVDQQLTLLVNGLPKFKGSLLPVHGRKKGFTIESSIQHED